MTIIPSFHGSFSLTRRWTTTPRRVFTAWADPCLRAQWFRGPPEHWTETHRSVDFRVGGREVAEGRLNNGVTTLFEAYYHIIEPNRRLVYTYDLRLSGEMHSVTLSTLDIIPEESVTFVSYTEQIVFMDGQDGVETRRNGTEFHFEKIGQLVG